jgi:hypothetical protein
MAARVSSLPARRPTPHPTVSGTRWPRRSRRVATTGFAPIRIVTTARAIPAARRGDPAVRGAPSGLTRAPANEDLSLGLHRHAFRSHFPVFRSSPTGFSVVSGRGGGGTLFVLDRVVQGVGLGYLYCEHGIAVSRRSLSQIRLDGGSALAHAARSCCTDSMAVRASATERTTKTATPTAWSAAWHARWSAVGRAPVRELVVALDLDVGESVGAVVEHQTPPITARAAAVMDGRTWRSRTAAASRSA